MEQAIRDLYSDDILLAAQERYGIAAGEIRPLAAVESFVYAFERGGGRYVLRIGHSLKFSPALIKGEVDWINHLAAAGVSVSEAIPSNAGNLVETIDDGQGGQFLVTAFVRAEGAPPHDLWTPALYAEYGRLMGRMHALAEHYQPARPEWRRPTWETDLTFVARFLPNSESAARQKFEAVCAHWRTLPTDSRSFGLIHYDAHGGNFMVDAAGRLTLFDFAECAYSWYAMDIAVALFFMVTNEPDPPALTRAFLPPFLRGYAQAYTLDPKWLRELPSFLKGLEIFLYAVNFRDFAVDDSADAWSAAFMRGRKERIENDVPYIDFDFETLAAAA